MRRNEIDVPVTRKRCPFCGGPAMACTCEQAVPPNYVRGRTLKRVRSRDGHESYLERFDAPTVGDALHETGLRCGRPPVLDQVHPLRLHRIEVSRARRGARCSVTLAWRDAR